MKHPAGTKAKNHRVALVMTWDGVRWPIGDLPPKARAFMGQSKSSPIPTAKNLSQLFADDAIKEIRICWVPRLKGGGEVLTEPFTPLGARKLGFTIRRMIRLKDMLGVVYSRK